MEGEEQTQECADFAAETFLRTHCVLVSGLVSLIHQSTLEMIAHFLTCKENPFKHLVWYMREKKCPTLEDIPAP